MSTTPAVFSPQKNPKAPLRSQAFDQDGQWTRPWKEFFNSLTNDASNPDSLVSRIGSVIQGASQSTADLKGDVLSVRMFGAVGDGVTNDLAAIQAGLDWISANGGGVLFFPPGVYYCLGWNPGSVSFVQPYQLHLGNTGPAISVKLVGDGAQIVSDTWNEPTGGNPQTYNRILQIDGNFSSGSIEDLNFKSLHGITGADISAVYLLGSSSYTISDFSVTGCEFRNFSSPLCPDGVSGFLASGNSFVLENGRDSACQQGAIPCVGISSGRQSNYVQSARVVDNYYNGCVAASVASNTTKQPGDGFLFGTFRGLVATGNYITAPGYEGIFVVGRFNDVSAGALAVGMRFPCIVANNTINCNQPAGTAIPSYSTVANNSIGIRCDETDSLIVANNVTNAVRGIQVYGFDEFNAVAYAPQRILIAQNKITLLAGQPSYYGISVTKADDVEVVGNNITWPDGAYGTRKTGTASIAYLGNTVSLSAGTFAASDAFDFISIATAGVGGVTYYGQINTYTDPTHVQVYDQGGAAATNQPATWHVQCAGIYMAAVPNFRSHNNRIINKAPAAGTDCWAYLLDAAGTFGSTVVANDVIVGVDVQCYIRSAVGGEFRAESVSGVGIAPFLQNIYAGTSGILIRDQTITWTPSASATGWYTIATGQIGTLNCRLRINNQTLYDNAITDCIFEVGYAAYANGGVINQLRGSTYNGGVISNIRISNPGAGSVIQLDIQLSTATSPTPLTIEIQDNLSPGFFLLQMPVGPGVSGGPTQVLGPVQQNPCVTGPLTVSGGLQIGTSNTGIPAAGDSPSLCHIVQPNSVQTNMSLEQTGILNWRFGMPASSGILTWGTHQNLSTSPLLQLDYQGNLFPTGPVFPGLVGTGGGSPPAALAGVYAGSGAPNGAVQAYSGSIYLQTGAGTTSVWFKLSGNPSGTGWVNFSASAPGGTWNSGTAYIPGSTVTASDGMVYVCTAANTNQNPSGNASPSYWAVASVGTASSAPSASSGSPGASYFGSSATAFLGNPRFWSVVCDPTHGLGYSPVY